VELRYLLATIILFLPFLAKAQLSAPGMSAVRYTSYPGLPAVHDPVFIYCNSSGSQLGTLTAASPRGTAPFSFTWYQWSDQTKSFSILLKNDSGVTTSTAANLPEGGYRVVISGGFDTSLVGWIFLDKPFASAKLQNRTCDYVALDGEAAIDTFYYSNPSTGVQIRLPNSYTFLWSSDPGSTIPRPDLWIDPQTFDPPLTDVTYNLQVTDSFGCAGTSSFFYKSIHVKADFSIDPSSGGAPLEVTITDKSVRASVYRWEFGENKDSISGLPEPPPHTYYIPGEYYIKLTVESDMHCIDSLKSEKIKVDPSSLEIPNVFSPDGDGINDYFVLASESMRRINVQIFSRSGLKVYSFDGEGEKLSNWKGWDGNINNSSRKASPGIYFYVIVAFGWDDVIYEGKKSRGFVYLYR
jgi:gliding motility-associated-like protein